MSLINTSEPLNSAARARRRLGGRLDGASASRLRPSGPRPGRAPRSSARYCARLALLALLAALAPGLALGLASDSEQPIEIEADFAELDDERGITVYRGDVVVVQGSLRLTGDKLIVNFTDEQELENAFLEGDPARFKQRPDGKEVDTEGEALQIEYHQQESLLYLIENASLNQGGKLLTGHRITYDTERSILTARKARASEAPSPGAGDSPTRERIRIVIPPKQKSDGE